MTTGQQQQRRLRALAGHLKAAPACDSALVGRSDTAAGEAEILYEVVDGGVAVITLNRPSRLNSLTLDMQCLYFDLLDRAAADPQVRVIVVTGAGRAFCAGAEMELLKTIGKKGDKGLSSQRMRRDVRQIQALDVPKPIIAAINGPVAGLGLVLAMHADVRFTTKGAKFTSAFAKRGLVAEHGISWLLPRIVGVSNAMDLLMSSRVMLGEEAKELGLATRAYPDADVLMRETMAYAREMARKCSPASLAEMKRQVYADLQQTDRQAAYGEAEQLMKQSFKHPDSKEGVASYTERRDPAFAGLSAGLIRDQ